MKAKKITLDYTTGKNEIIKPDQPGFVIVNNRVYPTEAWSMDHAYNAAATLMLSTMKASVDQFGSYTPLFDKLNEVMNAVKYTLAKETRAKEFAMEFQRCFLWDEIMEDQKLPEADRKYNDLYKVMDEMTKKAAEKMHKAEDPAAEAPKKDDE